MNDYTNTLNALSIVDSSAGNDDVRDEVRFMSSLTFFRLGKTEKAKEAAAKISESSCRIHFAHRCMNLDSLLPDRRYRNPGVAGALSAVIPGLGYAYSGRVNTGIAAAIINVLFIGTAVEAFRSNRYILGSASAIIGSGWYLGNVYGSYASAREYNRMLKNNFIKQSIVTH